MAAAAGARAAAACRSSSASSSSARAAMPQCAVATCRNSHRKTRGRRVRYHRFPAEAEARGRWVAACGRGRDGTFNASTARVCSLHFSARSYERDVQHELLGLPPRSRLRRGAVPDRAVPHAPDDAAAAEEDLAADVSSSGGGGDGIDVLLALGLTPTPRAERERRRRLEAAAQSAADDAAAEPEAGGDAATDRHLNKMHVMDEECKLETAAGAVISENAAASAASDEAIDLVIGADRKASIVNSTVASPTARITIDTKTAKNSNSVPTTARNTTALTNSITNTTTTSTSTATAAAATTASGGIAASISAAINNCSSNSSSENTAKPVELKQELKEELDDENAGMEKIVETVSVKQPESPAASRKRPSSDSDSSDRKKPRMPEVEVEELEEEEEWERERSLREAVSAVAGGSGGGGHGGSNEDIELRQLAERLRREIGALAALARAKEHEWNSILRLKKLKEESLVRLQRRRQVLMIEAGVSPENCGPAAVDTDMSNLPVDENMMRGTSSPPSRCSSSGSPPRTAGRGNSGRGSRRAQNQQSAATGSVSKGNPLMMVPVVSSSPVNGQSPRERRNATSSSRPLLPKPTGCNSSPPHGQQQQQQQNTVIGEGRKGPILDVRSIIADYRSKNPGDVPRRGRRLRGAASPTRMQEAAGMQLQSTRVSGSGGVLSMASIALGSGSQMRPGPAEVGDIAFPPQEVSRPSSADSGRSDQPGISFKDVLMQFARLSQEHSESVGAAARGGAGSSAGAPFPEVTLHPVAPSAPPPSASPPPAAPAPAQAPPSPGRGQSRQAASLLHGILSGQARASSSTGTPTAFSPTLARLLTAPERHPGPRLPSTAPVTAGASSVSIADLLSTNKTRNEITITPVSANSATKAKEEVVVYEELDDSTDRDRLVIDEGEGEAESVDDVPECQGCHQMAAQFVCAGCGNQWYCSRDCQVAAWDEHSEVCSG
ncbi:pneumococcal serine-rich repeat protein-like [Schistocerca cancellata]|uniref:pneumococcal serine-rich repeat protein-like n=1 Tax=Schistocerca cancellata TaxID=274614 RepID=UPI0021175823|nr:pneumococcal serine-rich repeat protein-like [Schistocerca cancellata]